MSATTTPTKKKKKTKSKDSPRKVKFQLPVHIKPKHASFSNVSVVPLPLNPHTRPHPLRVSFNLKDLDKLDFTAGDLLLVSCGVGAVGVCWRSEKVAEGCILWLM